MISERYKNDGKITIFHMNRVQKTAKVNIEKKITSGRYTFIETVCPVCGHADYEHLAEKDRYGLYCCTVICKTCGLLITTPRMTKESLNLFYSEDYRDLYNGGKSACASYFLSQYNRKGAAIIKFIRKWNNSFSFQNKLVLEVGCGAGGILAAFRDVGAEVLGFDLGIDYLEYGIKEHGLRLIQGTIEDYKETKKPDIIIYSHVLEHVSSLTDELASIKKICHAETLVYIEVPGVLFIQKTYADFLCYLQNAHLYHFSLGTLQNLLSKHGFSFVSGNEFVRSLFVPTSISSEVSISNCYHENMLYLRETERKRTINILRRRCLKFFRIFWDIWWIIRHTRHWEKGKH
jgi:2-polyprenyl-3-methyl-5-hydroxy-6-metoxy-1,4-benzoquinol methylase